MCIGGSKLVFAQTTTDENTNIVSEIITNQLETFNWEEMEYALQTDLTKKTSFSLKQEVIKLATGETRFNLENIVALISQMFLQEIGTHAKVVVRFVLIVFLCSMLKVLSDAFESKNTTKAAFFVCYLVILYGVMDSFIHIVGVATSLINELSHMIQITLPTLLAFMTSAGYITSSTALMPLIVSALHLCTFIIGTLLLPLITSVLILQVVSQMSEEIKVDQLVSLFYSCSKWVLRGILLVTAGIMGIYRSVLPLIDMGVKKSALHFSTAFIPVIGDGASSVVNMMLLGANQIKNSFALAIILWIVVVASGPLLQIIVCSLLYRVAAAVIQPIGDKRMAAIANDLAKGCDFIMSCCVIVVVLCILAMVICVSIGATLL
jgi:stage III sporulation protein AE